MVKSVGEPINAGRSSYTFHSKSGNDQINRSCSETAASGRNLAKSSSSASLAPLACHADIVTP